jgi:hypothetical protein
MKAPVIRRLLADRSRDRHLRHDGGAAAPDQAALGEEHAATRACRLDRRIHAGAARSDDQDVGLDLHGFNSRGGHARIIVTAAGFHTELGDSSPPPARGFLAGTAGDDGRSRARRDSDADQGLCAQQQQE